jgi:hypothetical protein
VVTFVNAPLKVGRGSNATLQAKTAPNTSCTIDFSEANRGRHESLMAPHPTFRPSAKQLAQVVPVQFLIPAIVFAAAQMYLARLTAPATTAIAFIASLAVFTSVLCWIAFVRNARVSVSEDGDVTVVDWLGRLRFRAPQSRVRLELLSIRDFGLKRDVAILAVRNGSAAVPLWREIWGDNVIRGLSHQLGEETGKTAFRSVSKRAFRGRYPHIRSENLPAIAVIVVFVLAVAVVVSRQ